ncbi:50S ribosomal protein L21 [Synechococcus sp. CS-1324]|uniref:50S ribosomal protein L21 n=1 Tax=Synechococcus sp. CS-1324 TaxID=2847980 RepID=UPI000DB5DD36|nr:50S ribosomal protein L21 [Synechococcus sp. CS-1324]MCT0230636.1 50S ribosomal protein L21 [Synechococcus sp. CS-1324]PZV05648.1 MAG: 50S ribosomal protein L21 [Cyanobium sp.]
MTNTPAGDGVPANELPANGTLANGISPAAPGPYAIAEASGQQFWLQPNRYYDLDRIHAEVDAIVTLDQILLVRDSSGTRLGLPHVPEATVTLKVIAHRRGPKILVYKMRPKKKTRRKNGHRQELTRVMVESITVGGQPLS